MQYVGQTKNEFSISWRAHRLNWNKFKLKKIMTKYEYENFL